MPACADRGSLRPRASSAPASATDACASTCAWKRTRSPATSNHDAPTAAPAAAPTRSLTAAAAASACPSKISRSLLPPLGLSIGHRNRRQHLALLGGGCRAPQRVAWNSARSSGRPRRTFACRARASMQPASRSAPPHSSTAAAHRGQLRPQVCAPAHPAAARLHPAAPLHARCRSPTVEMCACRARASRCALPRPAWNSAPRIVVRPAPPPGQPPPSTPRAAPAPRRCCPAPRAPPPRPAPPAPRPAAPNGGDAPRQPRVRRLH